MKQELTLSQVACVAGGGLYDHLPAPYQPPSLPSQSSEEKRQIMEQWGLGKLQTMSPNHHPW